jgi:hypothetical protein
LVIAAFTSLVAVANVGKTMKGLVKMLIIEAKLFCGLFGLLIEKVSGGCVLHRPTQSSFLCHRQVDACDWHPVAVFYPFPVREDLPGILGACDFVLNNL